MSEIAIGLATGVPRGAKPRTSYSEFGHGDGAVKQAGEGAQPADYDFGWGTPAMEGLDENTFSEMWNSRTYTPETETSGSLEAPSGGGGGGGAGGDFAGAGGLVKEAMKYVGTPYVWGGSSPLGFDCSGFTQYVFKQMGISLPRVSAQQGTGGQGVSRDDMRAGDLVFFDWGSSGHNMGADHVGIYIGNGKYVHAPKPGSSVHVSTLSGNYWARRYSK